MKNSIHLILILFIALLSSSCRSSKELIYLQDAANNEAIKGLSTKTTEHILQEGDILYISIKTMNEELNILFNPESNMEGSMGQGYQKYLTPSGSYLYGFEVDPDGFIKLPMLGKLKVAGVSVSQAEPIVQKKADELINDAIVKVKLLNFKITVAGEVRSPGVYYNYNNSITVIEALALAGGNTDFATIKEVMVVRKTADGSQSFLLDMSSKNIFTSEAFYLQPNDYVIVQPDKYKNFQLNSQAYSLIFSSLGMLLAVLGFVLK